MWDGKEMQEAGRLLEAPPRAQGAEGLLLVLCLFLRVAISLIRGLIRTPTKKKSGQQMTDSQEGVQMGKG